MIAAVGRLIEALEQIQAFVQPFLGLDRAEIADIEIRIGRIAARR